MERSWAVNMYRRLARHPWVTAGGVLTSFALIFGLTLVDGPFPISKVGPLAEWVAGIGALLAVLVALGESNALRVQAESDRARRYENERHLERENRQTNAARVVAMFNQVALATADETARLFKDQTPEQVVGTQKAWPISGSIKYSTLSIQLDLSNGSGQPIFKVRVTIDWAEEPVYCVDFMDNIDPGSARASWVVLRPSNTAPDFWSIRGRTNEIVAIAVILGHERLQLPILRVANWMTVRTGTQVTIEFEDSYGDGWARTTNAGNGQSVLHQTTAVSSIWTD